MRSGSGGLEFFFGFLQRLLDQADHEFLLCQAAVIGFLVQDKVFLYPLEQFPAYLKCQCFSFFRHVDFSFLIVLSNDHFDEFAHIAFRLPDFLADLIVQIQRDFAGEALGFHTPPLLSFSLSFGQHKHTGKARTKLSSGPTTFQPKQGRQTLQPIKAAFAVSLLQAGNRESPSSPVGSLLPAAVRAGKEQIEVLPAAPAAE